MNRAKVLILTAFVVFGLCFFLSAGQMEQVAGSSVVVTLTAPTGVEASDNSYSNKVGIHWDAIRDATNYRIFRNTTNNNGSATDVGTTPANYFFDTTATAGQTYFYWVRAENAGDVSSFGTPDQGVRSTGTIIPGPVEPLEPPIAPPGNPLTAAKSYLGKTLFWDEQLSSTKTVSCGTCHRPAEGGSDPRTVVDDPRSRNAGPDNVLNTLDDVFGSPGVPQNNLDGTYSMNPIYAFNEQVTGRKAPSYLNAGYSRGGLFWDGRASDEFRDQLTNNVLLVNFASLESQTAGPPLAASEMAHSGRNWSQVAARVAASKPLAVAHNIPAGLNTWIGGRTYAELFLEAFGTPDVTPARISMAIASHERTLFSDRTPLDQAIYGITPLTPQEESGRQVFTNQQCNACHGGALLADQNFHNIGVRPQSDDLGRGAVTGIADDNARFKTPNLRNMELHAPYMHNGKFATIEDVVEFYNRGGDFDAPNIDHDLIRQLNMTPSEKADLAAFMRRPLTDPRVQNELPPFDRPKLFTESNRVPTVSGAGRAGSGAAIPLAKAIEPPVVGNPSFTVAVSNSLGATPAVLVIDSADPGVGSTIPASGSFARVSINLSGTGSANGYGSVSLAIPNNPALVGRTFYGRWYITDAAAPNGFAVSGLIQFTVFGAASAPRTPFDLDGDSKTDLSIFRPGPGEWWYTRSSDGGNRAFQFGSTTDKIVPADYTGDGKTDVAFFRPSTGQWFVLRSEDSSFFAFPFGNSTDVPVPADYDGDGKADAAVFRESNLTWYINKSSGGTQIVGFGAAGDLPVPGDFDGDGKADIAIYRPNAVGGGQWWIQRSSTGVVFATQFGASTDKTVPGDYTGDGKTDIAFWRPSTGNWSILRSEDLSFFAFPFGASTDIPSPGDYDGDGKFDAGVFRPSNTTWFVQRSTAGTLIQQFGSTGDLPLPNAYVR